MNMGLGHPTLGNGHANGAVTWQQQVVRHPFNHRLYSVIKLNQYPSKNRKSKGVTPQGRDISTNLEAMIEDAASENENLRDLLARLQSENITLKQQQQAPLTLSVPKNTGNGLEPQAQMSGSFVDSANLEAKIEQAASENENLRDLLARLQSENMTLKQQRQAPPTFSMPKNIGNGLESQAQMSGSFVDSANLEAKIEQATSENDNLRDLLARIQSENITLKQQRQAPLTFSVPKNAGNDPGRKSQMSGSFIDSTPPTAPSSRTPTALASPASSGSSPKYINPLDRSSLTSFGPSMPNVLDGSPQTTAAGGGPSMDFGFGDPLTG